jgi:outer membrane cobalamin receptor
MGGARVSAGEEPTETRPPALEEIEEIRVIGFRTGLLADDPSSFATILDLDEFRAELKSLEDVLAQSVGVQVRRFGGAGERSEVAIRGSTSAQVVIMVDGVRLNSSRGGGVDLSSLPLDLYESVEVARGGGSVHAGSGAMGGVIHLKTARPAAVPVTGFALSGGSFGTWEGSLLRSAPGELFDYSLGYSGFKTYGDYAFLRPTFRYEDAGGLLSPYSPEKVKRINNRREKHAGHASLGRELGAGGYLSLRESASYASQGEPGLDSGDGVQAGQHPAAHQRSFHNLVQLAWEGSDFGVFGSHIEASLSHRFDRAHFSDPEPDPVDEPADQRWDDSSLGLSLYDTWEGHFAGAAHRFRVELSARRDLLEANDRSDRSRYVAGVALREDARLFDERLSLSPALRLDWTEGMGDTWVPSLGVIVQPLAWLRFKANIERSYRTPSFEELYLPDKGFMEGNPDLEAEEARNADVGLELVLDELGPVRDLRIEAAYFHNRIEDSIVWYQVSKTKVEPHNTGKATAKGYELQASFELTEFIALSANHTRVDATYDRSGVRLQGRAETETSARLEIREPSTWKLVCELQHTGSISVSKAGGYVIPARIVWDASAALNLARLRRLGIDAVLSELWVTFRAENLGDIARRDALGFPQPGRTLSLGLEARW